jgi:hypothetical protein
MKCLHTEQSVEMNSTLIVANNIVTSLTIKPKWDYTRAHVLHLQVVRLCCVRLCEKTCS